MTGLIKTISALGFALLLAMGFAVSASAAEGGVSRAAYTATDNPLLQSVSYKPCCYNPHYGTYGRSTPSTCRKNGGYVVQEGFCGGYGYQPRPGHPYPGWGGGNPGGYQVCCKRKRRDWWSPNAYTCQQQGGYVVNPQYCYNG
jgi:hypothetical protein